MYQHKETNSEKRELQLQYLDIYVGVCIDMSTYILSQTPICSVRWSLTLIFAPQ
jgi:hypothetical protein